MLIASKNKNQIVNMDEVLVLFVNNEKRIIAASPGGKNNVLDEYDTREEALCAMEMLINRIRVAVESTAIVLMPTNQEVKMYATRDQNKASVHHCSDGKKVKRHGGS